MQPQHPTWWWCNEQSVTSMPNLVTMQLAQCNEGWPKQVFLYQFFLFLSNIPFFLVLLLLIVDSQTSLILTPVKQVRFQIWRCKQPCRHCHVGNQKASYLPKLHNSLFNCFFFTFLSFLTSYSLVTETGWDMDPCIVISFRKVFHTCVIRHLLISMNVRW